MPCVKPHLGGAAVLSLAELNVERRSPADLALQPCCRFCVIVVAQEHPVVAQANKGHRHEPEPVRVP